MNRTSWNRPLEYTCEGIVLIEYINSNPNGDLNSGGDPKIDPIDGRLFVSQESLSRKGRDYVTEKHNCQPPFDVLIRGGESLIRDDGEHWTINDRIQHYRSLMEADPKSKKKKSSKKGQRQQSDLYELRELAFRNIWDLRTLGALLSVGDDKMVSAKGPFVLHDGISINPVVLLAQANTRQMLTNESEKKTRGRTIGNREVVRYALVEHMFTVSAASAKVTGMTEGDLFLALEAMIHCWSQDAAAHRRGVLRDMYLFRCPPRGARPVGHDWNDVVKTTCKLDDPFEASSFSDFEVTINRDLIPPNVDLLGLTDIVNMIEPAAQAAE